MAFLAVRYIISEQRWEEQVRDGERWVWIFCPRDYAIHLLERGWEFSRVDVR